MIQKLMEKKRRRQHKLTHCPNGHLYDEKNSKWYVTPLGYRARACRECRNAFSRKYGKTRIRGKKGRNRNAK